MTREYMKSQIVKSFFVCGMLLYCTTMKAGVQTDPALTGAIIDQMEVLKNIFKKRENTQNKIIAAETSVSLAMERMHDVEDKVLGYMANVQAGFQNLYDIKRAGELVAVDIPKNMDLVRRAVKVGGFQGTILSVTVGDELKDITLEMMSLYPFLEQLVTSGSYSYDDYDESGNVVTKKKKVNLLDSSERYYICNTVLTKLENINTSLYLLAWEIQTLRWRDLFYRLDPDGWCSIMAGANIAQSIISDWNYNLRYWNY